MITFKNDFRILFQNHFYIIFCEIFTDIKMKYGSETETVVRYIIQSGS